ncbi:4Fe-4S dicluster domain-containing protein [Enterococcus sp. AZ103]|uniref:4Fe-4S dicluster domain-containing protein n=1 Tax=Enterococcus sp. AZ103 TaxID=2774628 RepID=UPI003F255151
MYSQKTIDLAKEIAETCTECDRCMKDCVFLQTYCENPKILFEQFLAEDLAAIIPYSCTFCGRCTVVCPLQLKLADAFLAIRQDLAAEKLPLKQLSGAVWHQRLSCSRIFSGLNRGK